MLLNKEITLKKAKSLPMPLDDLRDDIIRGQLLILSPVECWDFIREMEIPEELLKTANADFIKWSRNQA